MRVALLYRIGKSSLFSASNDYLRRHKDEYHMLKFIVILLLSVPFLCQGKENAVGVNLFLDDSKLYFILTNNSENIVELPKNLIFGDCRTSASLCVTVTDENGKKIELLARPHNFDHTYKKRYALAPQEVYGRVIGTEEIIRRYDLDIGVYRLALHFRNIPTKLVYDSNTINFEIKKLNVD